MITKTKNKVSFESRLNDALYSEGLFDLFTKKKSAEDVQAQHSKREMAELKAVAQAKSFTKLKQFQALFKKLTTDSAKEALNHEFQNYRYKNGHEPMYNSSGSLGGKVSAINVPGRDPRDEWNESKQKLGKKRT